MNAAAVPPVLEIEDLAVTYHTRTGPVLAVADLSLAIGRGGSLGLVGESGCGKTTVAMAIMRYLGRNGGITGGRILFEGQDLAQVPQEALRRLRGSRMAMIYQEPTAALNPCLTIGRQLTEVPIHHDGASTLDAYERALSALSDVRMPDAATVMRRYPHQISGGQQQRVVIAMALLSNPALLLLDEPTTALDVTVEATVVDLIAELRQKYDTALLYISHNLGLISQVCDRVAVMYSGVIVEEGPTRELFKATRHPYTIGLMDCLPHLGARHHARALRPIPGQVAAPHERPPGCYFAPRCAHAEPGRCERPAIPLEPVAADGAHRVRCVRWREIARPEPAIEVGGAHDLSADGHALVVDGLDKFYDPGGDVLLSLLRAGPSPRVKANEKLSFQARKGEILAIVGESGCGKSTFAKVLTGLETATAGEIRFLDWDLAALPVNKRSRALLGALQMVFQNPDGTLNPCHPVGWSVARVVRKIGAERGGGRVRERVGEMLDAVHLPRAFAGRKPRQLSGGQKQRVAIARAFAGRPALVVADEPVSALDVSVQAAVIQLLMEIRAAHDTTLLFISHDLSVVSYISDRVMVMYLGQIMEDGPTEAILSPPYHPYTEALLSAVPVPDPEFAQKRIRLEGEVPSPLDPPPGCRFAGRCPRKLGAICDEQEPPEQLAGPGHRIKCHIPLDELSRIAPVVALAVESEGVEVGRAQAPSSAAAAAHSASPPDRLGDSQEVGAEDD